MVIVGSPHARLAHRPNLIPLRIELNQPVSPVFREVDASVAGGRNPEWGVVAQCVDDVGDAGHSYGRQVISFAVKLLNAGIGRICYEHVSA